MPTADPPIRTRSDVAARYGHPWPWRVPELVERYAVEPDVDLRDLAARWGCTTATLEKHLRRHGYRTENHRAVEKS